MRTILRRKHIRYDDQGRDVILALISVANSSELPAPDGIPGVVLHEGSGAWDISTGDEYGMLADGSWIKQPNGIPLGIYEGVF